MKFLIQYSYQSKNIGKIKFQSELVPADKVLKLAEDIEKKLQVKVQFIDMNDSEWLKKDIVKLSKKEKTEPTDIVVYFDGGYDKQSKRAGIGICIYYSKNGKRMRIRKNKLLLGLDNNNEAEYASLEFAIQELSWLEVKQQEAIFRGDSQLVIKQLLGEWSVYEVSFQNYLDRIEGQLSSYQISPIFDNIARNENKEAHKLATKALKGIEIDSCLEIEGNK